MIFAWPELKALAAEESLEAARNSLIDILSNYRGFHPCEMILVFDAYRVRGGQGGEEEINGIHVVYTREAELADNYIEKTIRKLSKEKDWRIRVATSDGLEQVIILGGGALRVSASEFRKEVEATRVEIAEILEKNRLSRVRRPDMEQAMKRAMERKVAGRKEKPEAGTDGAFHR